MAEGVSPVDEVLDCAVEPGHPAGFTPGLKDLRETCDWLRDNAGQVRRTLHRHGALYLHGLPVRDVDDFARVRDAVVGERACYREQATPRSHFGDEVYSSTDLPPSQSIRPHNENSYTLSFPGVLVFGCLVAPDSGGATPVTDVRSVLSGIPEPLARRFRETGWGLVRNYADHLGLGWRTAFGTEDRAVVSGYCEENLVAHEWCADGHLRTVQRRSAVIRHPSTEEEAWFNHVVFWSEWALDPDVREVFLDDLGPENLPFNTAFGDGEPLSAEDVEAMDEAYRAATVRETWKPGDVMVVDNILAAHARESFRGPRKILVAMGDEVSLSDCSPTVPPLAGFVTAAAGTAAGRAAANHAAGGAAQDGKPGRSSRGWLRSRGRSSG